MNEARSGKGGSEDLGEVCMAAEPRVTVCIPASRRSALFLQALDSALAQTYGDFEVVVTDDGIGELSEHVASRADPRVRYVANDRPLGLSANHCRAIELARGEIIAFLHDDDEWRPGYLAAAVRVLDEASSVGLVITGAENVDARGRVLGRRRMGMAPGIQSDPLRDFLRRDFIGLIPSASVFRRAALAGNVRPWPDVSAGDLTMYLDAAVSGWSVHHCPEALVRYRVHDDQLSQQAVLLQTALVTVLGRYRFEERGHERQRVRRIASALVARGAAHLLAGDADRARRDVRAAWRTHPLQRPTWSSVIYVFSFLPPPLYVAAERAFRAARARARAPRRPRDDAGVSRAG